jgi:hypothetical protein
VSQGDLFSLNFDRGQENHREAQRVLEERYAGFLLAMRDEARRVCQRIGRVTTDDLRTIAKIKGFDEVDPHVWGAIFKELDATDRPVWRSIGRTPSTLAKNNGRQISMWVLR